MENANKEKRKTEEFEERCKEAFETGYKEMFAIGYKEGKQQGQELVAKTILALKEKMFNGDVPKIMDMMNIPQADRTFYLEEINKLEEKQDKQHKRRQ